MADIKQIRLNGTDYDLRDARIVSGTIAAGESILTDEDVFLAVFRISDLSVCICSNEEWLVYPLIQNIPVYIEPDNGERWQIINHASQDATYDLLIHKD